MTEPLNVYDAALEGNPANPPGSRRGRAELGSKICAERDPEGEHELAPADIVCFRVGPDGAHKVTNHADTVARILMLSTIPENELSVCVYPDSDEVGVWPWPAKRLRLSAAVDYRDGEA